MEFEDKLFQVLRNFTEYGYYQGKVDKAVAAIRKSFPDRSKEEVTVFFIDCVNAYQEAILLVRENANHYVSQNKSSIEADIQFRKKHSTVPDQLISRFIGWIYHWHHER